MIVFLFALTQLTSRTVVYSLCSCFLSPCTSTAIQIGFQIRTRVQELGHGCIFLVQKAGALQICPTDSYTKRELIECARAVTEKVRSPSVLSTKLPQSSHLGSGIYGAFSFPLQYNIG